MPSYTTVCERIGCGCLLAAVALFVALMVSALCAAPTPRPIERLTPELMPGVWACQWGSTPAWFAFDADGTYSYGTGDAATHCGLWEIRCGELWMIERCVGGGHWTEYTIGELRLTGYPTIHGRARGGFLNAVTLHSPRRLQE